VALETPASSAETSLVNAAQLHYEMIQTRNLTFEVATYGQGEKLALLLHGFPESAHSYRYQIPLLVRLGYRVWAPNLRGYGKSDKPAGRRAYAMDRLEEDLTDLIDASGGRSVLLVGHGWGGALAWSYATYGARPIERLVLMNAPHPVCFTHELRTPEQFRSSWRRFLFRLPWLPERLLRADNFRAIDESFLGTAAHKENFSQADLENFRASAQEPGALTAMLNWHRAMPWTISLLEQRGLRNTTMPTLLLWGEEDHLLGKELTEGMERLVPKLSLHFIPGASHWVQQDAPEKVNALIEEWLRPTPRKSGASTPPVQG
jgi:pimeloyl-ACP methyl ester carboxylesterase